MLCNLKRELNDKKITIRAYAAFLGVTEKTVQNKINEITDFTYPEVKRTKEYLFPEFDIEYLFETDQCPDKAG
ncbi:hypothetical protein [Anaerotruncus rubiinfantis]|uniref:hypothetical protein n=1 Tax=Anaerotruncus rubiinfantis TaxID=1720200 RepID=UPI003D7A6D6F